MLEDYASRMLWLTSRRASLFSDCGGCTQCISATKKSLDSAGWAPRSDAVRSFASIRSVGSIYRNMIRELGNDILTRPRRVFGSPSIKSLELHICSLGSNRCLHSSRLPTICKISPILPLCEAITERTSIPSRSVPPYGPTLYFHWNLFCCCQVGAANFHGRSRLVLPLDCSEYRPVAVVRRPGQRIRRARSKTVYTNF